MARFSVQEAVSGGTAGSAHRFLLHGERGLRRPLMYIGIGSLILLIILLIILF
jgi:hypothetical protein